MKRKLNSNSGVTLLSLSLTIAIMLVLTITISININTYMEKKERINLETDILKLQEEIDNYYNKNNALPIINEYTNTVLLKKNINDNDKYYVIDLSKLTNLNLNYGADYNKIENKQEIIDNLFDIYIINEQSHTIYYPKGVQYKGKFYYTIEDKNNTKIGDIQLTGIEITGKSSGEVNEEIQLTANSIPKFIQNSGVIWSSSNTDIAEIDENGKVTLKAVGKATITAVLKDNSEISNDFEIECYGGAQIELSGNITFSEATWDKVTHKASVNISTDTEYNIQYYVGNPDTITPQTEWKIGTVAGELENNTTVSARLFDGVNYSKYSSFDVKDSNNPKLTLSISSTDYTVLKIKATAEDNETGIPSGNIITLNLRSRKHYNFD